MYSYEETRGGYHAEQFLSGFKGFLQSDAYSGYNWVDRSEKIISVGCHAHARRPFAELVKIAQAPGLAHQAITFYRKLYAVEDVARKKNLSPEERYELRQKNSAPVLKAFKEWLDHHLTKTSEQGKSVRRFDIAYQTALN